MTPKQQLLEHIRELHRGLVERKPVLRLTLAQLQNEHGRDHHRRSPNHFHEGVNLGPDARPEGWKTGEGAVLNDRPARPPRERE